MAVLFVSLLAILAILYWRAPVEHAAHAARAKEDPPRSRRRRFFKGQIVDADGNRVDLKGKLLLFAHGHSQPDVAPHGSSLVASYLTPNSASQLQSGDLVVVNAKADKSSVKRRLRVIDRVANGLIYFRDDYSGNPHTARPVDKIEAKVDWVARNA